MRQTLEYAKMAVVNIIANKMRSLLTMLGIIIGIAAVIVVLCIGGGGQKSITSELSGISNGSVYLQAYGDDIMESDYITQQDMDAISEMPGVAGVTMVASIQGQSYGTRGEYVRTNIDYGNGDYYKAFPATLLYGRLWDESDYLSGRKVCVIDSAGAKELFGSDNVVGLTVEITVDGKIFEYTIVGVVQAASGGTMSFGTVIANINMPISSMERELEFLSPPFSAVAIIGEDANKSAALAEQAATMLALRHGNLGRDFYKVMDMSVFMDQINSVITMFTTVIAAVAAISLLVGGIGVMNIMLVSVTERTREIGIRKALGAKTSSILFQFLIESATLTLVGGILGIILGVLGGLAIGSAMNIDATISPGVALAIALFSSVIGVFFGIYPARKAARLNPIEALRSE